MVFPPETGNVRTVSGCFKKFDGQDETEISLSFSLPLCLSVSLPLSLRHSRYTKKIYSHSCHYVRMSWRPPLNNQISREHRSILYHNRLAVFSSDCCRSYVISINRFVIFNAILSVVTIFN